MVATPPAAAPAAAAAAPVPAPAKRKAAAVAAVGGPPTPKPKRQKQASADALAIAIVPAPLNLPPSRRDTSGRPDHHPFEQWEDFNNAVRHATNDKTGAKVLALRASVLRGVGPSYQRKLAAHPWNLGTLGALKERLQGAGALDKAMGLMPTPKGRCARPATAPFATSSCKHTDAVCAGRTLRRRLQNARSCGTPTLLRVSRWSRLRREAPHPLLCCASLSCRMLALPLATLGGSQACRRCHVRSATTSAQNVC